MKEARKHHKNIANIGTGMPGPLAAARVNSEEKQDEHRPDTRLNTTAATANTFSPGSGPPTQTPERRPPPRCTTPGMQTAPAQTPFRSCSWPPLQHTGDEHCEQRVHQHGLSQLPSPLAGLPAPSPSSLMPLSPNPAAKPDLIGFSIPHCITPQTVCLPLGNSHLLKSDIFTFSYPFLLYIHYNRKPICFACAVSSSRNLGWAMLIRSLARSLTLLPLSRTTPYSVAT